MYVELAHGVNFHVSLFGCNCFLCHIYLLFSSFLLVCNGLFAALACTGIVLGALSAYGQAVTVTHTAVATDVHETLDVELDFGAEVALYLELGTNDFTNLGCLVVCPVLYLDVSVNAGLVQNLSRATTTYSINVGQGDFSPFVLREVYTNNSYCHIVVMIFSDVVLTLTEFVLGVFLVNQKEAAFATYDFAVSRALF